MPMVPSGESVLEVLRRGLAGRCPRCGKGDLFESWHVVRERCGACGLLLASRLGDTWFFMYMTTAALTGVLILAILLTRPQNLLLAQLLLLPCALLLIGGTLPYRKGLAIAIDYLIERGSHGPGTRA